MPEHPEVCDHSFPAPSGGPLTVHASPRLTGAWLAPAGSPGVSPTGQGRSFCLVDEPGVGRYVGLWDSSRAKRADVLAITVDPDGMPRLQIMLPGEQARSLTYDQLVAMLRLAQALAPSPA